MRFVRHTVGTEVRQRGVVARRRGRQTAAERITQRDSQVPSR